jgi:ClpP class serine protease
MWDLPSVLDIARQAADAIGNLVEEHGAPVTAAAAGSTASGGVVTSNGSVGA